MAIRTLVIGDIHAGLRALKQLLENINIIQTDRLIFLGDYVDGWSEAVETIEFLIQLQQQYDCIFLKGNHDDLLLKWLKTQSFNPMWLENGGQQTVISYEGVGKQIKKRHMHFLEALQNYHRDSENRLYVHAGFTNLRGVESEYFQEMFFWDRTLWELALVAQMVNETGLVSSLSMPPRLRLYPEIYIGHTPVTRSGYDKPHKAFNVWNVDTGAAFKGKLSCIEVNTKQIWQSEEVYLLYPEEQGRN